MASGLAAFYYLKSYGYEPFFIMQLGLQEDVYHNCHCQICLPEYLSVDDFQKTILHRKKHLIYVKKWIHTTEDDYGQHHHDGLLQSKLQLLFCKDDDDARPSKHGDV